MTSPRSDLDKIPPGRGLETESIVVKIRWFGIAMGIVLVQARTGLHNPSAVRAFLALGAGYAALDTAFYRMGDVFLSRLPLFVSLMESVFIALLCFEDTQLQSPFRWYYLLSLICCAIRYRKRVAWLSCVFHCVSFGTLGLFLGWPRGATDAVLTLVILLTCVTWASSSLSSVLRDAKDRLEILNVAQEQNREELETRVAERSEALRASQARVIQQEKMAAFGLLAAGIAHEVGNPLAALCSLVQMLRRRGPDPYTGEKLELADVQLSRIQRTIRELVDFARPASTVVTKVRLGDVVDEALGIAKFYQRTKSRNIATVIPDDLPRLVAVRDYLVQVILNLVLNAIDATEQGGSIEIAARSEDQQVIIEIRDDGRGISLADRCRIFQPYFTTKPKGTGLGLFVSRQIVEESGGTLLCQSEVGEGTVFTIRLSAESPILRREAIEPILQGNAP